MDPDLFFTILPIAIPALAIVGMLRALAYVRTAPGPTVSIGRLTMTKHQWVRFILVWNGIGIPLLTADRPAPRGPWRRFRRRPAFWLFAVSLVVLIPVLLVALAIATRGLVEVSMDWELGATSPTSASHEAQ